MTTTPHDSLVRAIFGRPEHAAEELRAVLPSRVLAELDLESLTAVDGSFIDPDLRPTCADLLFSADLRGGGTGLVYLLFEHQSSPDSCMPWRLLQYQIRIWERHRARHPDEAGLPPIVAVLLHHGPRPWPFPPRFSSSFGLTESRRAAFGGFLVEFDFVLDDLATQTDAQLLDRAMNAVGRLVLVALRNSRMTDRLFEHVATVMRSLESELRGPEVGPALARLAWYVFETSGDDPAVTRSAFAAALPEVLRSSVMTTAEMLRAEARRESLLEMLEIKFGAVDPRTRDRIEAATNETLRRWLRRIIVATRLEDVFADRPSGSES